MPPFKVKIPRRSIYCLLFFMAAFVVVNAQSKKDLEKKKEKLKKEIELTAKLLEETKASKRVSLNQLVTLNKQIGIREELISTINSEIHLLDKQIGKTAAVIEALESDLDALREEYAKMIVYAYRNRSSYNRLMFIFAAADFNQAYKRLKHFQQYSDYRKKQKLLIEKTQELLAQRKLELEAKRKAKTSLLRNEETEKGQLSKEKTEQVEVLNKLQEKEKKLRDDLKKKQRDEERLNKAIENIIAKEMEAARKRAAAARAKAKTTETKVPVLTPEAQKLSDDFASNRGKLPWPVEKGVITGTFGRHPHPVLSNIIINNNGVDINSSKGAIARAVFDGEVSAVVIIPGAYKAVVVTHGEYFSVYSNLEEVFVSMGDRVITKQSLGRVHTDEEEGKTELHLEIWKGNMKMDPATWLFMKR